MKPTAPLLFATIALAFTVPARAEESIYRCTDGSKVTFQWNSCAADQQEKIVLSGDKDQTANEAAGASDPAAPRAAPVTRASWRAQVRSPAPYVGISDDAVLNMRGWGRPGKIVRQRGQRAWLEHWMYLSPNGDARHLHFANGKLVAMNFEPAPYVVQLANVQAVAPEPGQRSAQ